MLLRKPETHHITLFKKEPMQEAAGVVMSIWQRQEPGWFDFHLW